MDTRCRASDLALLSPFTSLEQAAEPAEETDGIVFKNCPKGEFFREEGMGTCEHVSVTTELWGLETGG